MQTLVGTPDVDEQAARGSGADPAAVDAVLTASRSLIAVATRSLGSAAEETTIAQYRALVVLASREPQRVTSLAGALEVAPSTAALQAFAEAAGEVPDSQWPEPEPPGEATVPRARVRNSAGKDTHAGEQGRA